MRRRQFVRKEQIFGPATVRVRAVIRTGLEQTHGPRRILTQTRREHAAGRSSAHNDNVVWLRHENVPEGSVYRSSSRSTSRFRNFSGPSLKSDKNAANSPVSGRLEFSIPTSWDENSTVSRYTCSASRSLRNTAWCGIRRPSEFFIHASRCELKS